MMRFHISLSQSWWAAPGLLLAANGMHGLIRSAVGQINYSPFDLGNMESHRRQPRGRATGLGRLQLAAWLDNYNMKRYRNSVYFHGPQKPSHALSRDVKAQNGRARRRQRVSYELRDIEKTMIFSMAINHAWYLSSSLVQSIIPSRQLTHAWARQKLLLCHKNRGAAPWSYRGGNCDVGSRRWMLGRPFQPAAPQVLSINVPTDLVDVRPDWIKNITVDIWVDQPFRPQALPP